MPLPPSSPGAPERAIVQFIRNLRERMLCFTEEDAERLEASILREIGKIRTEEQSRAWAGRQTK